MRPPIFIIIAVFVGVGLLINLLIPKPSFDKISDQAEFELQANQPELAENTLLQMVLQDSLNIKNHYHYIQNHFSIPERKKVSKYNYEYRNDQKIQDFYKSWSESPDSNFADIGLYGKGLIKVNFEKYPTAISAFEQVKNKNLPYLNNSLGYAYKQIDSNGLAEKYFLKEIKLKGNLNGAYSNLITLLFEQNRMEELNTYLKNTEVKKYFPSTIERAYYFKSFQPIKYITVLLQNMLSSLNIWGAIAALLIMGSWIMYLRKLDIFEIELWRHIIFTVLLGMLFSFLTFPLSDLDNYFLGFTLNGGLINDFFYCVIGIGAVEEFVKIVPLLLMMRFTKAVNEPFDYIKYASLSALGFAFVENLIYFHDNNLQIIHGRALSSAVSHMFDSSIIAYGIILNKYKEHKNPYLNFLFFFALAAISHGFYDFWLINKSANTFSILTTILVLTSMFMWNSFKNNALNHSNFYDKDKSIDSENLQDYLLYFLSGILLFEYIALAFKYGPSVANIGLFSSLISGTYLMVFLSTSLSRFTLVKGEWAPIKYWGSKESIDYDNVLELELKLNSFTKNDYANMYLPNSGKIIERLTVSNEPDWYLVKLDTPKQLKAYFADKVLIRTKDKEERIKKGKKKHIAFYLIPTDTNLKKDKLKRIDFKFCGWATAE